MPLLATLGNIGKNILGGLPIVGGLIQGNMNAKVARENTDKTIAANREMAKYQYDRDLEMWNKGNVYNSPMAQMERLKAAGLNPNMVYGSGSAAGMSAGQLPKYNAPTASYNYVPPVDIPSMIAQFQNFRINSAQIRNTDAAAVAKESVNRVMDMTRQENDAAGNFRMGTLREFLASDKSALQHQQYLQKAQMFPTQMQGMEAMIRKNTLEQERVIAATKNLDLQNEYFAAKAITGLFGGAVGAMGKLGAMFTGGRAAKGALGSGTLMKDAQKWRQFDAARRRTTYP